MCLLNLIKEHDRVRLTPDRLGELTTLIVADIARRCTDQTSGAKLLLILAHINTGHHVLIVKEALSQGSSHLCLTDTCRAEEDKGTDRSIGILQASTTTTHRICNGGDRLILTNDTLV